MMEDQRWIEIKKKNEVKGGVDAPSSGQLFGGWTTKNKTIGHLASFDIDNNFRSEKKLKDKSDRRQ